MLLLPDPIAAGGGASTRLAASLPGLRKGVPLLAPQAPLLVARERAAAAWTDVAMRQRASPAERMARPARMKLFSTCAGGMARPLKSEVTAAAVLRAWRELWCACPIIIGVRASTWPRAWNEQESATQLRFC